MITTHRIYHGDATQMAAIGDGSIDLVVTSPPYPMIAMWDQVFAVGDPRIGHVLAVGDGSTAFALMHGCLDAVWAETFRVLRPGGIACINIGDATRTMQGDFRLYPNHARVLSALMAVGFTPLPDILWRKQTNSPTKFMGSGVLPAGAYVTLEHEYILIVRKGPKRVFVSPEDRRRRRESSFFWEERNHWFSDVWMDVKGTTQNLADREARQRSAAYPLEIPYRLISMFSVKGDVVLDPFLGTGTTSIAALTAARNSIGYELDEALCRIGEASILASAPQARACVEGRVRAHLDFVSNRTSAGKQFRHRNRHYGFAVVAESESDLVLDLPSSVSRAGPGLIEVSYAEDLGGVSDGQTSPHEAEKPATGQQTFL
ncbi:site-specific DNA-methyltransferase [Candidatus Fermentibacteria bacterium]|nr:site-specific DNA-methyltransferase [Candidatus Fermentibacteria bacterium]